MTEVLYGHSSLLIAAGLLVAMLGAIEAGYRLGRRVRASQSSKAHVGTIQAALLGVLGLLLGFTFSLALQRHDSRSAAVVDEANAIGTAYLRAQLLPEPVRGDLQAALRDYTDLRVSAGNVSLDRQDERAALITRAQERIDAMWSHAQRAVELDDRPVTTGLFVQALNEMIDSYGRRDAALNRHVPEVVLLLLFTTFLMTGSIVGYAAGVAGHRASFVAYIMVGLIVVLCFLIIDLDRPRRGLIEVSQRSMLDLQASMQRGVAPPPAARPAPDAKE